MFEKIKIWFEGNKTLGYILIAVVALFAFKKFFKAPVKRRRNRIKVVNRPVRRRSTVRSTTGKKPWQIKGSLAARRRMAQIRKRR